MDRRLLLIFTCTGVSFAHGSNDGQKGMGLIMLILVGIVPAAFALNLNTSPETLTQISAAAQAFDQQLHTANIAPLPAGTDGRPQGPDPAARTSTLAPDTLPSLSTLNHNVMQTLNGVKDLNSISGDQRRTLRMDIYLVSESLARLIKTKQLPAGFDSTALSGYQSLLKGTTNYIPVWVKVAVAFALGLGTMIGWKRIVVTVGEKIGKAHLTYAQGAAAELVAFGTIEAADVLGLPVSTTHVLSSGIAGTMVANHSGLQRDTVRDILLAWVLTLPVCVALGATLFGAGLLVVFRVLGLH